MDITSYLLGKQQGGGTTPTYQEKSVTITENGTTNVTADSGYDALSKVNITTNVSGGGGADLSDYFTSTITSGSSTTCGIQKMIKKIPDDAKISLATTSGQYMFNNCSVLLSIPPQFDTSAITNMKNMFSNCTSLKNVPLLDTSNVTGSNAFQNTFSYCTSLTDSSLDNILQMCINATLYAGTKTLVQLGFESTNYSASRIQALPHYQAFLNAGWTIGY